MLESPIDEIKSRLDIVDVVKDYVKLEKAGINYRARCPFHTEKTPSFFVNPSRQIWHCFGSCGEGGDIFKFIMKIEGVEFGDALRILANKAGVKLRKEDPKLKSAKQRIYEICDWALKFFERQMDSVDGNKALKYLNNRGIDNSQIKKWRIGYAPNEWNALLSFLSTKGYLSNEIEAAGLAVKKEGTNRFYDRFRGRIMFPIFEEQIKKFLQRNPKFTLVNAKEILPSDFVVEGMFKTLPFKHDMDGAFAAKMRKAR